MKSTAKLLETDRLVAEITVQATLLQWKQIKEALLESGQYYSSVAELCRCIGEVVSATEERVTKEYKRTDENETNPEEIQ